jgi:hypothetical protein
MRLRSHLMTPRHPTTLLNSKSCRTAPELRASPLSQARLEVYMFRCKLIFPPTPALNRRQCLLTHPPPPPPPTRVSMVEQMLLI